MFNYIWAGLIIIAMLCAAGSDFRDAVTNRFHNGEPVPAVLTIDPQAATSEPVRTGTLSFGEPFESMFGTQLAKAATSVPVRIHPAAEGLAEIDLIGETLPAPLSEMRKHHDEDNERLTARAALPADPAGGALMLELPTTRLVRTGAITRAAISAAQAAFDLALKLVGALVLWLGLLKIAEDAGLIALIVRLTRPLLGPLFPDVPRDHPAFAMIAMNLAGNVLSLGNAATPLGIKAMQELQKLNPNKDTATNAQVMLLALNTASVTLLPPATLVALMGLRINVLIAPIILTTLGSLVVAIIVCKWLATWTMFRINADGE